MPEEAGPDPRVSVIIPVHDGGKDLRRCLAAIAAAIDSDTEVIVVDDASVDGSAETALETMPEARLLRIDQGPIGPARARNRAAAQARGEFLVFVDADVTIHANAIDELLSPLIASGPENSLVATIGSYDDRPDAPGVAATYANLRHHRVHHSARNPVPGFWTGLGAVRRSIFEELDGFDEIFDRPSIEDVEFGLRIGESGRTIHVVPSAMGTHLKSWTIGGLWKTDLLARGIPWGRVMELHPALRRSLNGSPRDRAAILSLAFGMSMFVVSIISALAGMTTTAIATSVPAIAGVGIWCALESDLFLLIASRRGFAAMLGAIVLHAIHHLTVPVACLSGVIQVRWTHPQPPSWRKGLVAVLLILGAMTSTIVAVLFVDVTLLVNWLAGYESEIRGIPIGEFESSLDSSAVERIKARVPVLLIPSMALSLWVLWMGPGRMKEGLASIRTVLAEAMSVPRWLVLASTVLVAVLLVGMIRNLGVPMRTDEAATLLSYGIADPFVIIGRYGSPNNHMLHSLLLWGSVQLFGMEPWAVRLPALVATLTVVPLIAIAATRTWGTMAGLVAATIWVSMPFTVELGTNARGYSMVIATTLVMIALLPALRRQRPGSGFLFVLVGVIGLVTVPVMAYPLGILHAGLFLGRWGSEGIKVAMRGVPLAIMTVLIAAMAYLPSWIMAAGEGPLETVVSYMNHDRGRWDRLARTSSWIGNGWDQWTWPLSGASGMLLLLPIGIGLVRSLRSGGIPRMLAVGSVVGMFAIHVITGLAPVPWWAMAWAVPFLVLFIAFACTPRRPDSGFGSESDSRGAVAAAARPPWAVAVIVACAAIFLMPPDRFKEDYAHRVGVGEVEVLADWLVDEGFDDRTTLATGMVHGPINYELLRRHGLLRPVEISSKRLQERHFPIRLLATKTSDQRQKRGVKLLSVSDPSGLVLIREKEFGQIVVREFDVAKKGSLED